MFLTIIKPKKISGAYSSTYNNKKQFPTKFKKLGDLTFDN